MRLYNTLSPLWLLPGTALPSTIHGGDGTDSIAGDNATIPDLTPRELGVMLPLVAVIVFLAIPAFLQIYPKFLTPKPTTRPEGQIGWPLYFVGYAFVNNRKFGSLFMFGLLIDVVLRLLPFTQNFWR